MTLLDVVEKGNPCLSPFCRGNTRRSFALLLLRSCLPLQKGRLNSVQFSRRFGFRKPNRRLAERSVVRPSGQNPSDMLQPGRTGHHERVFFKEQELPQSEATPN
jgi:hypothetical protein